MNKVPAILPAICLLFLTPAVTDGQPAPDATGKVRSAIRSLAGGTPAPEAAAGLGESQRRVFDEWVEANAEAVNGVKPGPLKDLPWGVSTSRPAGAGMTPRVYLLVFDWHASGKLIAYGLTGGVRGASLLSARDTPLPIEKSPRGLIFTVPKAAPDPVATVVVLELEAEPQVTPLAIRPAADGRIVLHARDVVVHGNTVRYEPEPHKDTVGYWMDPTDWVRWPFVVTKPGTYSVDIEQGCGKGHGGSAVNFVSNRQTLKVVVEDTGHFQNFVTRRIGTFTFNEPGEYALEVRPTKKANVAVMDLRSVTLTPAPKE